MITLLETLEAEVLKLPISDRTHLLERLVASLDTDVETEAAWACETDRRQTDLDTGVIEAVSGDAMMLRLRARLV